MAHMAYKAYFQGKRGMIAGLVLAIILAAGAWWYQAQKQAPHVGDPSLRQELQPYAHLFAFENADPNLPNAAQEAYFERFTAATNALKADPETFNAWLDLGKVHKNMNQFEKARDAWIRLGEVSPLNSISFGNLGDLYAWFLHEPEQGEQAYLQALKNEDDDINFYRNLAEIYEKLLPVKRGEIRPLLEKGIEAAKTPVEKAELLSLLGSYERNWYQESKGDNKQLREDALGHFREVLKTAPDYPNKAIIQAEIEKLEIEKLKERQGG